MPPSSSSSKIGNLSKPPDTQNQSDPKPRQITQPIRSFNEFKKKVYPHARRSVLVPLAIYDVPTGVKPYVLPEEYDITKTIESMNAKIDVKGKGKGKAK
ncbi:13802_t:CDS:1, partial [Ambispora leptoticha]